MTLKVAVISDVHGNAFALEKVLEDVWQEAPDLILNLGDQVYGRADPGRAYALQADLGALEVRGNCEDVLERDEPLERWIRAQLPEGAAERLRSLPTSLRALDGALIACHGDLHNPRGHLFWHWDGGPYTLPHPLELRRRLELLGAEVVLCGHTHRAGCTPVGDTLLVNVGAVSGQIDGDPRARWALLEKRSGRWSVDFRRVIYDGEAAAHWALEHAPEAQEEAQNLQNGL